MVSYDRIDKSEGIDFDKTEKSIECMICRCYYFKDIRFRYQPYVCSACHDFSMILQNLSDFFILTAKNIHYRVYISGVYKKDAINILNTSNSDNKGVL